MLRLLRPVRPRDDGSGFRRGAAKIIEDWEVRYLNKIDVSEVQGSTSGFLMLIIGLVVLGSLVLLGVAIYETVQLFQGDAPLPAGDTTLRLRCISSVVACLGENSKSFHPYLNGPRPPRRGCGPTAEHQTSRSQFGVKFEN